MQSHELRANGFPGAARYAELVGAFAVSGLLHAGIDYALGMAWGESGAIRFYLTQAGGIVLEDAVQAMWRARRARKEGKVGKGDGEMTREETPSWAKVVGYVWVVVFLTWSTPVYVYPAIRRNRGEEKGRILPFSLLRVLL